MPPSSRLSHLIPLERRRLNRHRLAEAPVVSLHVKRGECREVAGFQLAPCPPFATWNPPPSPPGAIKAWEGGAVWLDATACSSIPEGIGSPIQVSRIITYLEAGVLTIYTTTNRDALAGGADPRTKLPNYCASRKYCWAPVMGTVTVLIPSTIAGVWLSVCQADGLEMSVLLYWTV